ncbi:MAG TPA: hypothetical protein VLB46_18575 [Pyrinomonadaceae bacterium]|nr:hypothetical protein [Pyrinomonadaceae bacterium]
MNGYFNNLALRTMNAGNLVEPRLPSLFEPQRGELEAPAPVFYSEPQPPRPIDAPPTEAPRLTVSIEESAAAEEVILREQPAVPTARSSSRNSKSDDRRATPAPSKHEDPTESPALVNLSTTQPPSQAPPTKTPSVPKSETKSVTSVSPQPASAERSTVTKVTAERSFAPAPQSKIETATTSAVEEQVSTVEEQNVYLETPATLKTPALSLPEVKPEPVERLIERSRNTGKTDFRSVTRSITNYAWRESEAPEPEPTINVTIGRVEVRAAPATNTKPTRTRQESPVMPLDEYLRKQRRGER